MGNVLDAKTEKMTFNVNDIYDIGDSEEAENTYKKSKKQKGSTICGGVEDDFIGKSHKGTIVDGDVFCGGNSEGSNSPVTWLWSLIKTTLELVFESLSHKDASNGYAGLNSSQQVIKNPASLRTSFQTTPDDTHIPSEKLTYNKILSLNPNMGINSLSVVNGTDSANDFDISSSSCLDSTGIVLIPSTSTITKRMDAIFASGSGNGGLYTASKVAGTVYYVFKIIKDSDGSIYYYADISTTAANKPAGYTYFRLMFPFLVDGSANNIQAVWELDGKNKIKCRYLTHQTGYTNQHPVNNSRILINALAPINSIGNFSLVCSTNVKDTTDSAIIKLGSTFETDVTPVIDNCDLEIGNLDTGDDNWIYAAFGAINKDLKVDSNK